MIRIALITLLIGCTDPVGEEAPQVPISATLTRSGTGRTIVSGCWFDGWGCADGTDPMRVRWSDHEIVAPYTAVILGGHYEAETDRIAGGDVVDVELDGDIGSIEMPFDNDFIVPATPPHASTATSVQWTASSNATSTKLHAHWLCNDSQGGASVGVLLATFDIDPGSATVDILGSRPDDLHDRACEVSIGVTAELQATGERIGLVARQTRRLGMIIDERVHVSVDDATVELALP